MIRNLKKVKRRSKSPPATRGVDPLRLDPTRTVTLRKAAVAHVRRKFAILRGKLVKLVLGEDAFGLGKRIRNAFCPTGEGGGVDPTCSLGSSSVVSASKTYIVSGEGINHILRSGGKLDDPDSEVDHLKEDVDEIDKAMSPASEDMKLFRGTHIQHIPEVGKTFEDRGYTSTSTRTEIAAKFQVPGGKANVTVLVSKGQNILRVVSAEHEVILPRGSRFEVISKKQTVNGWRVHLRLLNPVTTNRFKFHTTPQKVLEFQRWLRENADKYLLGTSDRELWESFAEAGFKKGSGRAFDDVNKRRRWGPGQGDFYQGSREHFLRSSFGRPETVEKLQLLSSRSFTDLRNVTDDMSARMSRTLMDGLARGDNPRSLIDDLVEDLDVSEIRAEAIARTEIVRAHAEGQLDAMERMGVEEVGVAVEWSTAGDLRVCPMCATLEGIVLTVEEAHGLIPAHPNCRCAFLPANVGEDETNQKRSKEEIDRAFADSGMDEPPEIDEKRPKSFLNDVEPVKNVTDELREFSRVRNVFCATGVGGGVDPTCSPGGATLHTGKDLHSYLTNHPYCKGKFTALQLQKIEALNPNGVQGGTIYIPGFASKALADKCKEPLEKVLPPGTIIKVRSGFSKEKLDQLKGGGQSQPPTTPAAPAGPSSSLPVVPYKDEHDFTTGKAEPGILNGVPFASAPHNFWEKTKDVDIKEPDAVHTIQRSTVMVQEDDGRVWIVQPTNGFGNRRYTLPGGTNEPHLTNQQNALKEVWEETGLQVQITGHLGDFQDSNNGRYGRTYIGRRVGGAPWDAKIENSIRDRHGNPAAESERVTLVTREIAAQRLHRTDDLAQLATVHPISVGTGTHTNVMNKLVEGVQPAARAYERSQSAAGNRHHGDSTLHAVQDLRGFNGRPTEVSRATMDALVTQGTHIEMMRGVRAASGKSAKQLTDAFKRGDHFPGHGCFGSGTYADSTRGSHNVARGQYSGHGRQGDVIRMAIPKTAKIIKQSELEAKVGSSAPRGYSNTSHHNRTDSWLGVHAALAGYDAIHVDGNSGRHGSYGRNFYVVLNRSIVTVQKESAKGHVIQ